MWYHEHIGGGRCPIVDTWWQTETGGIMISPLPGRHHDQARLGHVPAAGHRRRGRRRRRRARSSAAAATSRSPSRGRACCAASGATRSATSDTYWSRFPGRYFAGDGAKLDDDGYLWLLGRVDDVMNVSGHRISTTEVESALVSHPSVAEAAVVGRQRRDHRPGDHRLRHPARRARGRPTTRCCATTSATRSAPSPSRRRSSSRPTCPRPAAARSCAACCATWPKAATSATPPRWPTPSVVSELQRRAAEAPHRGLSERGTPTSERSAPGSDGSGSVGAHAIEGAWRTRSVRGRRHRRVVFERGWWRHRRRLHQRGRHHGHVVGRRVVHGRHHHRAGVDVVVTTTTAAPAPTAVTPTDEPPIADQAPSAPRGAGHSSSARSTSSPARTTSTSVPSIPKPEVDGWIVRIAPTCVWPTGVPGVDVIHLHHGVWLNAVGQGRHRRALPERFFAAGEEKTIMSAARRATATRTRPPTSGSSTT